MGIRPANLFHFNTFHFFLLIGDGVRSTVPLEMGLLSHRLRVYFDLHVCRKEANLMLVALVALIAMGSAVLAFPKLGHAA
jgi:hypothetical protein